MHFSSQKTPLLNYFHTMLKISYANHGIFYIMQQNHQNRIDLLSNICRGAGSFNTFLGTEDMLRVHLFLMRLRSGDTPALGSRIQKCPHAGALTQLGYRRYLPIRKSA